MSTPQFSFSVVALFTWLILAGTSAQAQVLYDNGSAALGVPGTGEYADTGDPNYSMTGDVFTALNNGTAYSVDFAGVFYNGAAPGTPPATNSFVISLYSTSGGAPDTLTVTSPLFNVSSVDLGLGKSRTVYEFSGLLDTPFTLTAGTSYYLGISDTSNPYEDFAVDHTTYAGASSNGYSLGSDGFVSSGKALSFDLVVPEPGEWALVALSLAGLIVARKWRSRLS
jgi:hypothetical protein